MAKKTNQEKYIFCGQGLGIPGLPHEITYDEAKTAGVLDILEAAILRKVYRLKARATHPVGAAHAGISENSADLAAENQEKGAETPKGVENER